jgi:hypothetical protein
MATTKAKTQGPTTLVGQVLSRLDDIENWFREGYKTKEVVARLHDEGILMHPTNVMQLLKRYGKNEATIRKLMAVENGHLPPAAIVVPAPPPPIPAPVKMSAMQASPGLPKTKAVVSKVKAAGKAAAVTKTADAVADLKAKEERRVEFRPNARPNKKELLYGEED